MSSIRTPPVPSHTASASPLRVVGLAGSLRHASRTRRALAIALEGARSAGASVELIDLRAHALDLFDADARGAAGSDTGAGVGLGVRVGESAAARLRRLVGRADGVILATPEYHGGYSGVLKNALDHLSGAQLEGKVIGLIGVGGSWTGGVDALNGLRTVGRSLRAWVLPEQASVPRAGEAFDERGALRDPELRARLERVGRRVATFARAAALDRTG